MKQPETELAAESEQILLTTTQRQDLERRLAGYEADPSAGSSWEDVKARLREQP